MFRPTMAEIDLSSLRKNLETIRQFVGSSTWLCPMVKADAYGHGSVAITRELENCKVDAVGVSSLEEGLCLRKNKLQLPVLVFTQWGRESFELGLENDLTPVIGRFSDLEILSQHCQGKIQIHLKVNTGMNRFGFNSHDADRVASFLKDQFHIEVVGICSHLIQGDDWSDVSGQSRRQADELKLFAKKVAPKAQLHLHNSASIFSGGDLQSFGARPGIAIYGNGRTPKNSKISLHPVMSFKSAIVDLHHLRPGQGVSYNWLWKAERESVIALVPCGYADGYPRILSNKSHVLVRDMRVPLVGTVCMDYIMLDVSQVSGVQVNDEVILWGSSKNHILSADDLAEEAKTISYELLSGVSSRVPRRYIHSE